MSSIQVPREIWSEFIAIHGGKYFTVALRLVDGRELEDIRVDANGVVVGKLFSNGQPLSFDSSAIVGIRSVLSLWLT